jgi:hypothetical protein
MSFLLNPYRFAAAAPAGPTLTYRGTIGVASGNVDIGAAAGTRLVVMCAEHVRSTVSGRTITGGSIDGSAATIAVQFGGSAATGTGCGILYREVTSGGSVAFSFTVSGAVSIQSMHVYTIASYASATPTDTASGTGNDPAVLIDFPASGVVIGCASANSSNAFTWSGLTEDHDLQISSFRVTAASLAATTAGSNVSVSVASANTQESICAAAWL